MKRIFSLFGFSFIGFSGLLLFVSLFTSKPPLMVMYLFLAQAIMCFCLAYLYPQFKQKDERMRRIREKGMFASFIALMVYFILFIFGLQLEFITLNANELLYVLIALMITTIFVSFVIYSKIY
ncbi:permease [Halalkalibacter sp. AB-rgal2]|uniref:permease n=1 Tax=Halalkalibacter sp. AB-rgal2 TaxID=3242695 RepID=UPI00359EB75E